MKRVQHLLTDSQLRKLQILSNKTGLTVSELIRRAIDVYIQAKETKITPLEEAYKIAEQIGRLAAYKRPWHIKTKKSKAKRRK